MPRAPKKCPTWGCEERIVGRRFCKRCSTERLSPSARAAKADPAERKRRAAAVAEWVAINGWVCPGWRRPAHVSRDLTAAHSVAVVAGGTDSVLSVLCRSCNSSQGKTPSP